MKMNIKAINKSLFTHIILGIIGVVIITVSGLMIGVLEFQKFQAKESEKIKINGIIASNKFKAAITSFELCVKMLDEWITENPDKDPRFDKEFNRLVEVYREHTKNKIDIRMVTNEGKLFYFPSKDLTPLADVKDREYYSAHREKNIAGIYFAKPVLSRVTGKWGIPISYRVKSKNSRVFILFGAIEFSTLDSIFKEIELSNEGAVIITRKDGKVLYINPFDEKIVGKDKSELIELDKNKVLEKNIVIITKKNAERRVISSNSIDNLPVVLSISKNYDRDLKEWLTGLIGKMSIVLIVIVIFILLNLKMNRLFKQLQDVSETKNKFIAMIAHDMKGPIGNGVLLMEMTLEDREILSKDEIFERIETLKNSIKTMYNLLDNLLTWSIMQKKQIEFIPLQIESSIILKEALEIMYPMANLKKIEIKIEKSENFLFLADKQMLITIFRNIISNSIKFTKEGGTITISIMKNRNEIVIKIKDSGIGMKKEKVEKLFDNNSINISYGTKNERGTGLGLILCKEFIKKHGGKIEVKSEEGVGSEFIVKLPYRV